MSDGDFCMNDWIARLQAIGIEAPKIPERDNSRNTRLHIQFFHSGIYCFTHSASQQKELYEKILSEIWGKLGTPTDIYYHEQFSYCFLTFRTHSEAEAAIAALNDVSSFQGILDTIRARVAVQGSAEAIKAVNMSITRLFVEEKCPPRIRASWAAPRPPRDTFKFASRYEDDCYAAGDDCPDGFDKDEWENYCEGRGS